MRMPLQRLLLSGSLAATLAVQALVLNVTDDDSIRSTAATIAHNMMSYYTGNQTGSEPGLLPPPYYWWEAGAMWGSMVEYWHYTGDTSNNEVVSQAILAQASPTNDFRMPEEAGQLGNDDQVFWALTAMTAAERGFTNPSSNPAYIDLAKNVFNDMAGTRWNTSTCNGGLQWQFNPNNAGFYYKSSIANGGFFQLAARLARYTANGTYSEWAEKTYDWMTGVGLIDDNFHVNDGTDDTINCTQVDGDQWSYNVATLLVGSAFLANINAEDDTSPWLNRTQGLLNSAQAVFFSPFDNATSIMFEQKCEKSSTCNVDQFSFKAYLSRWMVAAAQMVPNLKPQIMALITASAEGAALSCNGNGVSDCGTKWYVGEWDGTKGLGQQMSALEVVQGLLVNDTQLPLVVSGN